MSRSYSDISTLYILAPVPKGHKGQKMHSRWPWHPILGCQRKRPVSFCLYIFGVTFWSSGSAIGHTYGVYRLKSASKSYQHRLTLENNSFLLLCHKLIQHIFWATFNPKVYKKQFFFLWLKLKTSWILANLLKLLANFFQYVWLWVTVHVFHYTNYIVLSYLLMILLSLCSVSTEADWHWPLVAVSVAAILISDVQD